MFPPVTGVRLSASNALSFCQHPLSLYAGEKSDIFDLGSPVVDGVDDLQVGEELRAKAGKCLDRICRLITATDLVTP